MIGIIPAAGKGSRLRPITEAIPKELMPFGHKTLLHHVLDSMKSVGVEKVCIVTGHQKGPLMDFVKDGDLYGLDIHFAYQVRPQGLGHAILCGKTRVKHHTQEDLLVILGDTVIEPKSALKKLVDVHTKEKPLATFFLHEVSNPEKWGVVKPAGFHEGVSKIDDLFEKPQTREDQKLFEVDGKWYAIVGVYCFNQKIFEYIEKTPPGRNNEIQITDAIKLGLKNGEKVLGVKFDGAWLDIGTPRTYLLAQWNFFRQLSESDILELSEEWDRLAKRIEES